ncbi:MAG: competence/damage-inducible protein A [Candidatus Brocadiia bacterium]
MTPQATIISTGQELVLGRTVDSNAAFLADGLSVHGFHVRRMVTVGDEPDALEREIQRALQDGCLVIVTGGLGPTADDRTRGAIARAVGRELVEDEACRRHVEQRLATFGRQATPAQLSQARIPSEARVFPNSRGTARGFACEVDGRWLIALPGVPVEMRHMFADHVLPFLLEQLGPPGCVRVDAVHLFPISEADVDERLCDVTDAERNPSLGITVNDGIITVTVSARGESPGGAEKLIHRDFQMLKERFGELVLGRGVATLAEAVSQELERAGRRLAVAESVTGGLIGHMLVDVPGISRFFLLDVVAYSNAAKVHQLGVPEGLIEEHGAVSPEVARSMAEGARDLAGADLGLSSTGIAGPTGGSPEKPVGLVYVALAADGRTQVRRLELRGDRWRVKDRAAKHALNMLRLALKDGLDSLGG